MKKMEKNLVEEIIEKISNNEEVIDAVNNIIITLNEKYDNAIEEKDFDIEAYDKAWGGQETPYLFSIDDEFDKLAGLIEDVADIDIDELIHSDVMDEQYEYDVPCGSRAEFAWWFACQLSNDKLLRSGHPYEGNVQYRPTEDDMEFLREYKDAMKDLGSLLTDGEDATVKLDDCPCGYGGRDHFTIEEAITAFCNSNFGIANNFDENDFNRYWIFVKSDNTLIKRDLFEKLLKFGTPFNVNGNMAIKSNNIEEVKELLKDSWYSVIDVKDALITDIPFNEKEIAITLRNINK